LIDIGSGGRHRGVDERRLAGDGERLLHRGRLHLDVDGRQLAHLHLQAGAANSCEAGEFGGDAISADAQREAKAALAVGDGDESIA
jgi:hypothetical protein